MRSMLLGKHFAAQLENRGILYVQFQVSKASAILVEEILDGIYFWLCGMTFCCIYLIFELLFSRALLMDVKLKHKASVVEEVVHVPYLY